MSSAGSAPTCSPSATAAPAAGEPRGRDAGTTARWCRGRRRAALPAAGAHYDVRRAGAVPRRADGTSTRCRCWCDRTVSSRRRAAQAGGAHEQRQVTSGRLAAGGAAPHHAPTRPRPVAGERCEMCAEPIGDEHQHVVDLTAAALMCTCRGCYLLFTDQRGRAALPRRARPVPVVPGVRARPGGVGRPGDPGRAGVLLPQLGAGPDRRLLPGPAGATESELPLGAWDRIVAANPALARCCPDVEALLVRGTGDRERDGFDCHLVPIDACYELVGRLRRLWRGFDGGQEARQRSTSSSRWSSAQPPAPAPRWPTR